MFFVHMANVSPLSFSSICSLHQLLREICGSLAAKCSANFLCLTFGAQQVVYSEFIIIYF